VNALLRPTRGKGILSLSGLGWGARPSLWSLGALATLNKVLKELGSVSTTLGPARPWPTATAESVNARSPLPPGGAEYAARLGQAPLRGWPPAHVARPERAGFPLPLWFGLEMRESEGRAPSEATTRWVVASGAQAADPERGRPGCEVCSAPTPGWGERGRPGRQLEEIGS